MNNEKEFFDALFYDSDEAIAIFHNDLSNVVYVNPALKNLAPNIDQTSSKLLFEEVFTDKLFSHELKNESFIQNKDQFVNRRTIDFNNKKYTLFRFKNNLNKSIEEKIAFFLGNIDEVIFTSHNLSDGKRGITYISSRVEDFIGIPPEKFINGEVDPFGLSHPDDQKKLIEFLERINKHKKSGKIQYRVKSEKTNSYLWVELSIYPQINEEGFHFANFGIFRDISKDVEADNLLRQSEQKHRLLFSKANDAIMILKNMEMVDCNEKTLAMFDANGFVDISGTKLYELMPEKQPDGSDSILTFHYYMEAARKGDSQFFYWKHCKINGEQFDAEVSISAFDLEGESNIQVIVRDITKRVQAEEQKNQSIKSYFEIFNYSSDLIFVIDNKGKVIDVNQGVLDKYQDEKTNIVGSNFDDLGEIDLQVEMSDEKKNSKTWQDDTQKFNWWGKTKKGEIFPLEMVLHPGTYFGEEVIIASGRDISERLEYESIMRESEERFRTLASHAPIGIFLTNSQGEAIYVNDKLQNFAYFPSTKGFMDNWLKKVHPEDQPKVSKYYGRSLDEIDQYENEYRIIRKKGDERWVKVNVNMLKDINGKPTGRVGIIQDITESIISAKKIQESERSYRQLVEILPDSVILHSEKNIVFANPKASGLLGISSGKKQYSILNYLEESDKNLLRTAIHDAIIRQKRSDYFEIQIVLKDETIEAEICCLPFVYHQESVAKLVIHDISARKRIAEEQLRAELAEETNRILQQEIQERLLAEEALKKKENELKENIHQKEVLLKEVHHRVKNNLQVISSILNLQTSYLSDPNVQEVMMECQDRIKSMAFIHESLYQSEDLAKVNFSEYLQNLCSNLKYSYMSPERNIKMDFDIESISLSLDSAIPCGLIVNELVSNCFKYAFKEKTEGNINIKLAKDKNNNKILEVHDSGLGLPKELDFRNTESLGLQLVVTLVDQIDGVIEYEFDKGSKFTINFKRD